MDDYLILWKLWWQDESLAIEPYTFDDESKFLNSAKWEQSLVHPSKL